MSIEKNEISPEVETIAMEQNSFQEIQEIIKARYTYFLNLSKYMQDVNESKISEEDTEDFLLDVLGFHLKPSDPMRKSIFDSLKILIANKLETYKSLILATLIKNQDQSICLLNILLDVKISESKLGKRIISCKNITKEYKLSFIFHDYDWFTSLQSSLSPHIPSINNALRKNILVRELTQQDLDEQNNLKRFNSICAIRWKNILKEIKFQINEIDRNMPIEVKIEEDKIKSFMDQITPTMKRNRKNAASLVQQVISKTKENLSESASDNSHGSRDKKMSILFLTVSEKIASKLIENNSALNKISSMDEYYKYLKTNVEFYFELHPILMEHYSFLSECKIENDLIREKENFKKFYVQIKDVICLQIDELEKDRVFFQKKLVRIEENPAKDLTQFNATKELLNSITKDMPTLKNDWPALTTHVDKAIVLESAKTTRGKIEELSQQMRQIRELCKSLEEQITMIQRSSQKKQEKLEQERKEALKKERCEFFASQEEKIKRHKDRIEAQKQEKKFLESKAVVQTNPVETLTRIYKNVEFEQCLHQLSIYHLELLRSIHLKKKGIKYHEVYSLITNQLGGKIKEIGNGSSHKRIELARCYIEIISQSSKDETIDIINTESKVIGGFFKPHGDPHTSGLLSRFNLSLISDVLNKAGITLGLIETILEQRASASNILH